jgi:hypothetical protein
MHKITNASIAVLHFCSATLCSANIFIGQVLRGTFTAMQHHCCAALLQCSTFAVQHYCSAALLQCSTTSVQQYCMAALLHGSTTGLK